MVPSATGSKLQEHCLLGATEPKLARPLQEGPKAHGQKLMAWVGLVDGKSLPVHWFHGSVNSDAYLKMLKTVMWPAVKARATRQQY